MGPLKGIKVIEFSALGPGPFCGMILADLGAEVIVIDRIETAGQKSKTDIASRGKKSIAIDLKKKESINLIKDIIKEADVVIEQLNKQGVVTKTYNVRGAFPTNLSAIDVNYDSENTIEEFTVEMQVQYWESNTTS